MINLSQVLIKPIVTEKSIAEADRGRYAFYVHPDSTKTDIIKAAKAYLDVDVAKVNVSKIPGKMRFFGKIQGRTKDRKKAFVSLKSGQKIELFES